ncbi:MAG TPA: hypothetical protein VHZ03_35295 [Trebonia sp.]|jgi:hypothetical protein|nr:hypothetical protein [Trebonia sp.]
MTNDEPSPGRGESDPEGCSDCDPGLLDDLKCQAYGIQEQAAYNSAHGKELDDARKAFDAARDAYNSARHKAKPIVDELRCQLDELEDRIRCQLDRRDVECIDRAFGRVVERLNRCGHGRGCCCDEPCDFDDEVRDCDPDEVPGRLAMIEHRTKEASDCFWDLIGEGTVVPPPPPPTTPTTSSTTPPATTSPVTTTPPTTPASPAAATTPAAPAAAAQAAPATPATTPPATPPPALTARVAALKADIDEISKATADGSWEPVKLYAAVLVARRHLRHVWRGFRNVNEYMDCLCQALTCMIKGHAAIGELTRLAAVNRCFRESWKAACKHLEEKTVVEVLAEYLRVCADEGPREPDPGADPEGDRDRHTDHPRRERRRFRDRGPRDEAPDQDDDGDHDDDSEEDDVLGEDEGEDATPSRYPWRSEQGGFQRP